MPVLGSQSFSKALDRNICKSLAHGGRPGWGQHSWLQGQPHGSPQPAPALPTGRAALYLPSNESTVVSLTSELNFYTHTMCNATIYFLISIWYLYNCRWERSGKKSIRNSFIDELSHCLTSFSLFLIFISLHGSGHFEKKIKSIQQFPTHNSRKRVMYYNRDN